MYIIDFVIIYRTNFKGECYFTVLIKPYISDQALFL